MSGRHPDARCYEDGDMIVILSRVNVCLCTKDVAIHGSHMLISVRVSWLIPAESSPVATTQSKGSYRNRRPSGDCKFVTSYNAVV